jgi:hypothetical protein
MWVMNKDASVVEHEVRKKLLELERGSLVVRDASENDVANVIRWFTHAGVQRAARWVALADRPSVPPKEARSAVELSGSRYGVRRRSSGHVSCPRSGGGPGRTRSAP